MRSAPCSAAVWRAARALSALPATSPTVGLSCAMRDREAVGGARAHGDGLRGQSGGRNRPPSQPCKQPLADRQQPGEPRDQYRNADRGRAHVLDHPDLRMMRAVDLVGELLDRGIEQFDRRAAATRPRSGGAASRPRLPRRTPWARRARARSIPRGRQLPTAPPRRCRASCCGGAPHALQESVPSTKRARQCRARHLSDPLRRSASATVSRCRCRRRRRP